MPAAHLRADSSKAAHSTLTATYGLSQSAADGSRTSHRTANQLQPAPELGQTCEPQGTRWHEAKLYQTTRHRGILVYDPQTKGLDFDAEGNLFFTDPWGTGPGPGMTDRTGAVYQYSRDCVLRKVIDSGLFPNGIALSPDDSLLAVGDFRGGRTWYAGFSTGSTLGCPQCTKDPLHLTFASVKAGTYIPGNGDPDGIHYDVRGNLWAALAGIGGIAEIDPRGIILGFAPIPNGDNATTNFAFGGPEPPGARSVAQLRQFGARCLLRRRMPVAPPSGAPIYR
jgi:gluconolactonase